MKLTIFNNNGIKTGRCLKFKKNLLKKENNNIIYLEIKRFLFSQRQGTNKSKERSEITGSTRKIQRQKGSGNARKGDIKNPIFRSGGRIFGPKPRNYNFKLNKNLKRRVIKDIINFKLKIKNIKILEDFDDKIIKTKLGFNLIKKLDINNKKILMIYDKKKKKFFLSYKNLKLIKILSINELNSFNLANADYLIFFESAIKKILKINK